MHSRMFSLWVIFLAACAHGDLRSQKSGAMDGSPAIRGVVLDAQSGRPVEDAQITLCDSLFDPPADIVATTYLPGCQDDLASTTSRTDGTFTLATAGLRSGGALIVRRMSHLGAPFAAEVITGAALRHASRGRVTVRLWPVAHVLLRARSPDGQPVPIAQAGWFQRSGRGLRVRHVFCDGSELSSDDEGIPPGPLTVYLIEEGPRRRYATAQVNLRAGERRTLTLTLEKTLARARLRLTDSAGQPLALLEAWTRPVRPSAFEGALMAIHRRHGEVGLDGGVEIASERAGPMRINVMGWRYRPDAEPNLAPVVLAERDVQMTTAEAGVTNVEVQAPRITACSLVDRDGRALPIGEYRVSVVDPPRTAGIHSGGDFAGIARSAGAMALRFPWIAGARTISVRLKRGDQRMESDGTMAMFSGSKVLDGPTDPCVIVSR